MPGEPVLIDEAQLAAALTHYRAHGYARLGKLMGPAQLAELRARTDELMTGQRTYPGLFFQLDAATGRYEDLENGKGWQGPSRAYRKLEKLEQDPLFRAWIEEPTFGVLARAVYPGAPRITVYRAIVMSKPEGGGTPLPWHQDGGRFWGIDREPALQVWTALDDAPQDGGCLEVLPGSHADGLATPLGGVVPEDHVRARDADARAVSLPAEAGEVLLLHNHVWHRSARSRTGQLRRAFSVCYMDGATRCLRKKGAPRQFFQAFPG